MPFAPADGWEWSAERASDNINTGTQTAITMASIDCLDIILSTSLPVAILLEFPAQKDRPLAPLIEILNYPVRAVSRCSRATKARGL